MRCLVRCFAGCLMRWLVMGGSGVFCEVLSEVVSAVLNEVFSEVLSAVVSAVLRA